jgi:hypothetical protein
MPRGQSEANKTCSDEEFVQLIRIHGPTKTSKSLGVSLRSVYKRRRNLEKHFGLIESATAVKIKQYPHRQQLSINNGTVLIGSDFHIWPGEASTCLRAFKKFIKDHRPDAVILNGDVMDFPRISRHPQNWESAPDPQEEIEAAQDHLSDMVAAGKRGMGKIWTLGNHDARFEAAIANALPQFRGIAGVHLADHFPVWQKAMSCFINEGVTGGAVMVKHRFSGGMHATRNNTLKAGVSMVTGHLHSQNVRPLSDYNQFDRYGVDTGCVADKDHSAFLYTEDAPVDWRSGFALLTFKGGRLLYPELITKWSDNEVQFRGQIIKV